MLHDIINEEKHCLDVKYDISGKMNIFNIFFYTSLVIGTQILEIILIAMGICYNCFKYIFLTYFLMRI